METGMIELGELQDAVQKAFPSDQLATPRDAGWELAAEMGWLMIRVPEGLGGLGMDRAASTAVHYELGRVLATFPLALAQATLAAISASSSLHEHDGWVEEHCAGAFTTMALGQVALDAGDTLTGSLQAVPDFDMAGHVLVATPELVTLVPAGADGLAATERQTWDESRKLFDLEMDNVAVDPALVLARGEDAAQLADTVRAELFLALAADCLGGATAALAVTVEYLQTRKQFERPIGMFQALKHRAADLKTKIAAAEALLWERARDAQAGPVELGSLKALASETYAFVTEEMIQLHGGIGLTEEHQCHLFMKRAMLNLQLAGSADSLHESAGRNAVVDLLA